MRGKRLSRELTVSMVALCAALLTAVPSVAQKKGGTLRLYHNDNPPSASLHEEATIASVTPFAAIFNNLVVFDPAKVQDHATFEQPTMRVHRVGYGYGAKELPWPNAVRVWLGEPWAPGPPRLPTMSRSTPLSALRIFRAPRAVHTAPHAPRRRTAGG